MSAIILPIVLPILGTFVLEYFMGKTKKLDSNSIIELGLRILKKIINSKVKL